jgi:PAS domain S-box-containing protein
MIARSGALPVNSARLHELETELAEAQRVAQMGSWSWNAETGDTLISNELYRVFRRPAIPPFAQWSGILYSPEAWSQLNAAVQESVRTGVAYDLDLPGLREDGTPLWINTRGEATLTGGGELVGLRGTMQDITARRQTQEKAWARAERHSVLFECAPVGIVIVSPDSHCIDANPGMCLMLGYTRDELVGLHASEYVAEKEIPYIGRPLELNNGSSEYGRVWQFRRKDGSSFEAETLATRMPDGTRLGFIRDFTERKQKAARIRRLVDSNAQGVMFWNVKGDIVTANDAFLRIVGYTREDLESGYLGWAKMTPPEYIDLDRRSLEEITSKGVCTPYEKEFIRKDGSRVPVLVGAASFEDSSDEGVCFVVDITARKRVEDALQDREEQLRLYAEHSPAAIAMFDHNMKYLVVSRRWMEVYNLGDQSIIGRSHYDVFPEISERWADIHLHCLAGAVEKCDEEPFLRSDGTTKWIRWEVRPWRQADGSIGGIIIFSEDVSDSKVASEKIRQLNAALEQRVIERTAELGAANQELEAFSYSVSHDLRAPLRAVNGFAKLVLDRFGSQVPVDAREYLELILKGGQQMGQLIDDLLAFSQFSRQSMNRQIVNSVKLVQTVLDESVPQCEGRQIDFRVGALPPCQADSALLKQVWVNLISNAIKYSRGREPAVIEIGCERKNDENVYFVRDNGAGFDMRYMNKLFGVFQRLHGIDEFEGTGVGLAIVQRIVNRHGGRIWAEAAVGCGATFYFTLESSAALG